LEPGIVGSIYPSLKDNMISIGPNNVENHSPQEKVEISSMGKTYNFLKALIEDYAK
jgi:di/tripeptidase